ncbi:hypothetical protein [Vreelandella massiliensis]|uniref:hypothetical protein n=1 Tax=Vreelandella massiliensis TaxID=1816686 RepID=UPI00096A8013|nr:hypothetical protein [Halomonas massiliensis]
MTAHHDVDQMGLLFDSFLELGVDPDTLHSRDTGDKGELVELDAFSNAPNQESWSNDDVYQFVERFFTASISTLGSPFAGHKARDEARGWLLSDDTAYPLSFVNCCAMLGYDHDELRSRVLLTCKNVAFRDW